MALPNGLLEGIRNLDPLPVTAQRLAEMVAQEDTSADAIAELLEFDQAVAANILRVANSSIYAGLMPLQETRQAVIRLGTSTLLHIVLGDYLKRLFTDAPLYDLTENDLWLHGAVAALAINELMEESPSGTLPPTASVGALIHDVGKLIIVRYMKADVRWILAKSQQEDISFVEAERAVLGCDHAEVGGAIARQWRFPDEIADALARHHEVPVIRPTPMLDGIMLANLVAKTLGTGLGAEGMNFELDPDCSRRHGITLARFCRVCARTSIRMEGLREAYGIPVESASRAISVARHRT
jgi:putative nucleotidyltransferase with HDIG domain